MAIWTEPYKVVFRVKIQEEGGGAAHLLSTHKQVRSETCSLSPRGPELILSNLHFQFVARLVELEVAL